MRVYLDDKRPLPPWHDVLCTTAHEAIELLKSGNVTAISLDHDLGEDSIVGTGYMVALFIEEAAYNGTLKPLICTVHSQNPVGAAKMKNAIQRAELYWIRHSENRPLDS